MKNKVLSFFKDLLVMIFMVTMATVLGILFMKWKAQITNVVVLYILSVVLTARFTDGYFNGIAASIISLLAFNWFFTEPFYSLNVNDITFFLTFVIMTIAAIVTSALTTKFKKAAKEAEEREIESNALYQLTNHLTDAEDMPEIISITAKAVGNLLSTNVACICFGDSNNPTPIFLQQKENGEIINRELDNEDELKKRMQGLHSAYDIDGDNSNWPIYGHNGVLGVVRIPLVVSEDFTEGQNRMVLAILENSAMAIERFKGLQEQAKNREEIAKERYRSNLLRAISHDIRTPLTGIMGSSEMLMSILPKEEYPHELANDIYKDADWLHALVENILSLTRLQDKQIALEKIPEAVEEVVGAAINTMEKRAPDREIQVEIPDTLLLVPMNARLINQVLVNLLDNAASHSESGTEIKLKVEVLKEENVAQFTVIDNGEGLPKEDLDRIFQMFYTTNKKIADSKRGIGLGLTICQTIVEAHGGNIRAQNRQDTHGAEFIFTLPLSSEGDKQ